VLPVSNYVEDGIEWRRIALDMFPDGGLICAAKPAHQEDRWSGRAETWGVLIDTASECV